MINLFSHNLTAYESAIRMLGKTSKAAIIHPTGTGKSFIAFKLCEDNADKRVLWLSPSEYIFKTQIENLKSVCGGYAPDNIAFMTYAKLTYMSLSEIALIQPDFIVLDEFHRCGAIQWGKGVQSMLNAYPKVPVLGLSATNIRYLDNQRDMADELFDGNVASEMTLGEAIVRGILNPPKYVLSVFRYEKDLAKYDRRVRRAKNRAVRDKAAEYLEALRRSLDKADGLPQIFEKHISDKSGKYIVFCSSAEHMDEMAEHTAEWFGAIDLNPHVYRAYSERPETGEEFEAFKNDKSEHLKLLFCIDMLNEGVHVEDVSGVILLRPTVSPIIYKQQIGRALSAGRTSGAVIFDIVMNVENLYSIGSIQEEMQVVTAYYRSHGLQNRIVNENFKVTDEVRDCVRLFEKLNDTLTASWDYMYEEAKRYYEANGSLEVPMRYKTGRGYSLGHWLHTQRKVRRHEQFGILGEDRIKKLDEIGMVWENSRDLSWKRYYAAAKRYYAVHGDLKVPASYRTEEGINLGAWIANLRTYRRNGAQSNFLNKERISALDAVGMIWDVTDGIWTRNYNAAVAYFERFGNLDVPADYVTEDGIKLGAWLNNLRAANKGKGKGYRLTQNQKDSLNAIGMVWLSKSEAAWERGYSYAKEYYLSNGNLDVPPDFLTDCGFKLGRWVANQRSLYGSADKLSAEKRERLDAIGMTWVKEKSWDRAYLAARRFYGENGHLNVPYDYRADGIWLNKWINEQKQIYAGERGNRRLTEEQVKRLELIGITWQTGKTAAESVWNKRYSQAESFYSQYGSLNVSGDSKAANYGGLRPWLVRQRKAYADGQLSKEQIRKLETIGMEWRFDDAWEKGFSHAEQYYNEFGDLLVPCSYLCGDGYKLGRWICNQRSRYADSGMDDKKSLERQQRLNAIGMVWNVSEYAWERAYEKTLQYKRIHNDLAVTRGIKDESGFDLGNWIYEQRRKFKHEKLSQDKIIKLAAIGVIALPNVRFSGPKRTADL